MDQLYPDPFSTSNSTLQKAFAQYFMKSFQRLLTTRLHTFSTACFIHKNFKLSVIKFMAFALHVFGGLVQVWEAKTAENSNQVRTIRALNSVSDPILNKTPREIFKLANFPGLAAELEAVLPTNHRQWLWDSWSTRVTSWHQLWDA